MRLYPNGYVDQFDYWVSSYSWGGEETIRHSSDHHLRIKLRLHVSGKRAKNGYRLRPVRWHAKLSMEYVEVRVAEGRCKSLSEAQRAVRALDLSESVDELLRAFYAQGSAVCVFVESDRPTKADRLMGRLFEPCLTMFGRYPDYMQLPSGRKYLVIKPRDSVHLVDRSVGGYSSTSNPKIREQGEGMTPWVSAGVDQGYANPFPI